MDDRNATKPDTGEEAPALIPASGSDGDAERAARARTLADALPTESLYLDRMLRHLTAPHYGGPCVAVMEQKIITPSGAVEYLRAAALAYADAADMMEKGLNELRAEAEVKG